MFGNAPKAVWSRWFAPDEQNRIEFCCRALLVDTGEKKILLETGIGAFFEPKLRERYGVFEDRHVLLDSLEAIGLGHEAIDVVVLSHLHFDHAGGLFAPWQEGQPLELLFPNATFVVGARAFERAKEPHPRDRASFIAELPALLEATGRLRLWSPGASIPELPDSFAFIESYGHTPGMLHTSVNGAHHSVFFCADLIPGTAWIHLPITMGYDRYPEQLIDEKAKLYERIEPAGDWLYFTHDERYAMARVGRDERGRYHAVQPVERLPQGWDLDKPALPE
jgi:glyoxylase-like metal-dependent hydrolase (beta-lactamase superfamily II)